MNQKFDILVADPPYNFYDRLRMSEVKRGAQANYPTMTISEIAQLPVKDICNPAGTLLALWVPSSLLPQGLQIMEAWGFVQKTSYIWVKTKKYKFQRFIKWLKKSVLKHPQVVYDEFAYDRAINSIIDTAPNLDMNEELAFGMGRTFRASHEICLIGINNTKIYKQLQNKSQRSVSFAPNLKHSAKPEALQNSLEIMFPSANKIELFARHPRPGWVCLGNEIDGKDIRVAISEL